MANARSCRIELLKNRNIKKIKTAIKKLEKSNKKITTTAIAKLSQLDRKTVSKYMKLIKGAF